LIPLKVPCSTEESGGQASEKGGSIVSIVGCEYLLYLREEEIREMLALLWVLSVVEVLS